MEDIINKNEVAITENTQSTRDFLVLKQCQLQLDSENVINGQEQISIFIIKKKGNQESLDFMLDVAEFLSQYNCQLLIEQLTYKELEDNERFQCIETIITPVLEGFDNKVDLLITIGGDGTILWSSNYFQEREIPPIIAYALGTLNFMSSFQVKDMEQNLRDILSQIYQKKFVYTSSRMRVSCQLIRNNRKEPNKSFIVLNEAVIERGLQPLSVILDIYVNGQQLTQFLGDGIIISSPTGSTAYNLSAGGPIVYGTLNCIIITPICPLSLSFRPIILPDNVYVKIKVIVKGSKPSRIVVDGNFTADLNDGDTIELNRSPNNLEFLTTETKNPFNKWISKVKSLIGLSHHQ